MTATFMNEKITALNAKMKELNVMNKCFKRIIASAMSVVTALSVTCTPIYTLIRRKPYPMSNTLCFKPTDL